MAEGTNGVDRREKTIDRITTYLKRISPDRADEIWAGIERMSTQRVVLIAYIVEHQLDPHVKTDHHPSRKELEDLPTSRLEQIAEEIRKSIEEPVPMG